MKQHITVEQLNELSSVGKEKLRVWIVKEERKDYWPDWDGQSSLPLLSIGQMIEYLRQQNGFFGLELMNTKAGPREWAVDYKEDEYERGYVELCDALWEKIKNDLER